MIGAASLVPPTRSQPLDWYVSYVQAAFAGSALAETSLVMRLPQPVSVCQVGFGMMMLQPLPVPLPGVLVPQAVSDQPREFEAAESNVPPTAVTKAEDAG